MLQLRHSPQTPLGGPGGRAPSSRQLPAGPSFVVGPRAAGETAGAHRKWRGNGAEVCVVVFVFFWCACVLSKDILIGTVRCSISVNSQHLFIKKTQKDV